MEDHKKQLILFMPAIEGGGVEKNIILIGNYLSKRLKKVSIITFDKNFISFFNKNIKFISWSILKEKRVSKYIKYFFCLILLIKEILKNKKKIVVLSFQANIYAIIICKIFNVSIITRSNSSPSGWSKNYLKKIIFKKILSFADNIIVNSKDFKKELDTKFHTNSKLIYNPLNVKEIKQKSKNKINFDFFNESNSLKIINIARFTEQKDHITLLKSFNLVNKKIKSKLLIIGYGSNHNKIKNYIKKNNLGNNVKILNFQKNPYKYLRLADIFILTSKFEGLPNVLLEALTLKKYIISTDCPTGPKEILNKGEYGTLVKIGDYKKIFKHIIFYKKNKNYLIKKSMKGYKSLKRFDFDKNCNAYYNVVKQYLF
jgi:glycosyltransferase involved in cell wall biosynthesis